MNDKRYTEEFKIKAVKQITEHGYAIQVVAKRLGVSSHSLYLWRKKYRLELLLQVKLTTFRQNLNVLEQS